MHPRKRWGKYKGAAPLVGGDRVGSPPDALLHHVLSFLPVQEAVRTCLLARRWRHLWKSATGLRVGCGDAVELTPSKIKVLQRFVDHLLLLRQRTPLKTFQLSFAGFYDDENVVRLNLWFRHVVTCQVRILRLENICHDDFELDDLPLVSWHLTRLQLVGLDLRDSFCNFSSCPSLEHLELAHCNFWFTKKISSQSLKCLSIRHCRFSKALGTRICVPSLVSLWLDGYLQTVPVLESTPSLQEAFVRDVDSGDCDDEDCYTCYGIVYSKCLLLEGLSEAKNLELTSESKMFIYKRNSLHLAN